MSSSANNASETEEPASNSATNQISRPASAASSATGRQMDIDSEIVSPVESVDRELEDDDDVSVGYEESAERDEIIRERINRTQEHMKFIVDNLSEDQLKRYERFRRVGFARPTMEKLMQKILDQRVNSNSVIVTTGIAKVFVGELIEGARVVMEEEVRAQLELSLLEPEALEEATVQIMEKRPLEPFHILESHRRMKHETFNAPHSHIYFKPSPF